MTRRSEVINQILQSLDDFVQTDVFPQTTVATLCSQRLQSPAKFNNEYSLPWLESVAASDDPHDRGSSCSVPSHDESANSHVIALRCGQLSDRNCNADDGVTSEASGVTRNARMSSALRLVYRRTSNSPFVSVMTHAEYAVQQRHSASYEWLHLQFVRLFDGALVRSQRWQHLLRKIV